MATCFYHASVEAPANCLGCKNPICEGCKAAGKMGFCGPCLEKVAALSGAVEDIKKTGVVAGKKATIVKTVRKAKTGQLAADRCFHHFEVKAVGTCSVCSRVYCPACLNEESSVCYHCETLEEESKALAEARARRRAARESAEPAPAAAPPPLPPQAPPAPFVPPAAAASVPQAPAPAPVAHSSAAPQVVVQAAIPPWIYAAGGLLAGLVIALAVAVVVLLSRGG